MTDQAIEDLKPFLKQAILAALESIGEASIKEGPFFGVGEYRRKQLSADLEGEQ